MDSPMDPMTLTMVQFEKATRNLKDIPIVSIVILIWLTNFMVRILYYKIG